MTRALKAYVSVLLTVVSLNALTAQEIDLKPVGLMGNAQSIYPMVYDSALFFASDIKWDINKTIFDQKDKQLFKIFRVDLKNGEPVGRARKYFDGVRPYNMFAICFGAEGNPIVTQNNMQETVVRGAPVGVFAYEGTDKQSEGERMSHTPSKASCGMPSISPDGKMMVFTSDMRGGEGRLDLYYCVKTAEGWSKPINMGPNVNTPGIENSPFIHPSGKIFFSSNGRDESQGLDIFYTYQTEEGFAEPKKFDTEVNSLRDDYGLYYNSNETWGYLTSNRDGRDQLYFFRRTFPEFTESDSLQTIDLCYTFYEASAENYDTTSFVCNWSFGDGYDAIGIEVDHCYDSPGTYIVELSVLDKTTGELLFSLAQYDLEIEVAEQVTIEAPEKIRAGESVTFKASAERLENFYPTDFYWTMGNGEKMKGEWATTTFDKPGTYRVECGTIDVRNHNNRRCTWISIEVE